MRIIHTADWHLGQILHGVSRAYEHERFLDWLLDRLEEERADALIVAGDIFDVASPAAAALGQYYGFLARLRSRLPALDVLILAGNHDSPARLDAPSELLGALGIHVVGELDREGAVVPLHDAVGEVGAYAIAVPFLRRRDLPAVPEPSNPRMDREHHRLVEGTRALYTELYERARRLAGPSLPILATGHCYMSDGIVSELSERKIQVGYQHALPVDVFPDGLAYVALGHLHRAQSLGDRANVRYSGSPIPLSLVEKGYEHQVLRVDLDGAKLGALVPLFVPRTIDILSVPEVHAPLDEVLVKLAALPRAPPEAPERTRPFLEVRVLRDAAQPRLRKDIEAELDGAWPRLLRIDARRVQPEDPELPAAPVDLGSLAPLDVFDAAYRRQREPPVPEPLRRAFSELVEAVERGEAP